MAMELVKNESTGTVVTVNNQNGVAPMVPQDALLPENYYSALSPEKKAEVDNLVSMIDIQNVDFVSHFGSEYKAGIDSFSNKLLEGKSTLELGEAGTLLDQAVKVISDFDESDWNSVKQEPSFIGKLFSSGRASKKKIKKAIMQIQTQYKDVSEKIQFVAEQLMDKQKSVLKIYDDFSSIYTTNKEIYANLSTMVCAAQIALKNADEQLASLEKDPTVDKFVLREYQSAYSRFNKKVTNLVETRYMLFTLFPRVQIIQEAALDTYDSIQSIIDDTIPLWKSEMAIAVGIQVVTSGAQSVNAANELTRKLYMSVAESGKQMVEEVAKASSEGIIDVDTARKLNQTFMETVKLANQARSEKNIKLKNEASEITKIHGELIQQLTAM